MSFLQRQALCEAMRVSRVEGCSPSEEQAQTVAAFRTRREQIVERHKNLENPPSESCGRKVPTVVEACVKIGLEAIVGLQSSLLGKLPLEPLGTCAALLGPVALAPFCIACSGSHKVFHPGNFVPTYREENRRARKKDWLSWAGDDDLETLSQRSDLDDEDDFLSALFFENDDFGQLQPSAVDDLFLAMRRKPREDCAEHCARLEEHFSDGFLHHDGQQQMELFAKQCWLTIDVARCVFPNHVFSPPSTSFFPRSLHVAVLANDIEVARMLLRFAKLAACKLDTLLYRQHIPSSNFAVMSPLFLALLLMRTDELWLCWSKLLVEAGARFNGLDSCIAGNIVAHEAATHDEVEAFDVRVRHVFALAGTPADTLEEELRHFEDHGFEELELEDPWD